MMAEMATSTTEFFTRRQKLLRTVVIFGVASVLGWTNGVVGPTLLDLEQIAGTDTEGISWILTSRALGGLLGVLIASRGLALINPWVSMATATAFCACTMAVVTSCGLLATMCTVFAIMGVSRGYLDSGMMVLAIAIWGDANGPWLQAMQTCYGISSLLAPFVAQPFLSSTPNVTSSSNVTNGSRADDVTDGPTNNEEGSSVFWAYLIIAIFTLVVTAGLAVLACADNSRQELLIQKKEPKDESDANETSVDISSQKTVCKVDVLTILFLCSLVIFNFTNALVQNNYGNYLSTYAVNHVGWSKPLAATLTSLYWGSFTAGRAISIVLSKVLHPRHLVGGCICIATVGFVPLMFLVKAHPVVLWVCTALIGCSIAPVLPAGLTWTERHLAVTACIGAVIFASTYSGEIIGPIIMGALVDRLGTAAFTFIIFGAGCILVLCYVIVLMVTCNLKEKTRTSPGKEDTRDKCHFQNLPERNSENM